MFYIWLNCCICKKDIEYFIVFYGVNKGLREYYCLKILMR